MLSEGDGCLVSLCDKKTYSGTLQHKQAHEVLIGEFTSNDQDFLHLTVLKIV